LLTERIKGQSGYSLVEVMVSIMILAIAILPMVAMFDVGLHSATRGSNYDKARALANLKMEEAKNLSFADVENDFPEVAPPPTSTPYDDPTLLEEEGFTNFKYRIEKVYIAQPPTDSPDDPAVPFEVSDTPTDLIRITVIVQWGDVDNPNTYTTFGLVTA
jgi:prepilin-type N-terminal cleavage/methylation domain-containing protein